MNSSSEYSVSSRGHLLFPHLVGIPSGSKPPDIRSIICSACETSGSILVDAGGINANSDRASGINRCSPWELGLRSKTGSDWPVCEDVDPPSRSPPACVSM